MQSKDRMKFGNQIAISDPLEVNLLMDKLMPGDRITLKNGIWQDCNLFFRGKGAEGNPIVLTAETPGEVILTGCSTLQISGEHLTVDGLFFRGESEGCSLEGRAVVTFEEESRHCRLTHSAIVDYNPTEKTVNYIWIALNGTYNSVDSCCFKGKNHAGQVIKNIKCAKFNRIADNYFTDIPPYGINGLEIIQVFGIGGNDEANDAGGAYFLIENNLFEHTDGECAEIISLKSSHNIVRKNTFRESQGGLVIRSGHNTLVERNCFIGGCVGGSDGIRITGENNRIYGNDMYGLQGHALSLMAGEYIYEALTREWKPVLREGTPLGRVPMYNAVKRNVIKENTFIKNEGTDIEIGFRYLAYWPRQQRVLLPEDCTIEDNIIVTERSQVLKEAIRDNSIFNKAFKKNSFKNNRVYGNPSGKERLPEGISYEGPAWDEKDREMSKFRALQASDVGPEWVKRKRADGDPSFQPRDNFSTVEEVPWGNVRDIMAFCTGSCDAFVGNRRMKIDAKKRELCPIEKEGRILLPVEFSAFKWGARVLYDREVKSLTIKKENTEICIEGKLITITEQGGTRTLESDMTMLQGKPFLQAELLATLLDKKLVRFDNGVVFLTGDEYYEEFLNAKDRQELFHECFKATASSFHIRMFDPPPGKSHGDIPANTLKENSSLCWTAYGDGQWIRYDLGSVRAIDSLEITFAEGENTIYSFDIEASGNGLDWSLIINGHSRGVKESEVFRLNGIQTRYLRLIGHMNNLNNRNSVTRESFNTRQEGCLVPKAQYI